MTKGRVLIIAGSDPSGGAGIQADIKTITALGGYAMSAITAITVQNTIGVFDIQQLSASFVKAQARACLEDIGADAIKIGMIGSIEVAQAIKDLLLEYRNIPVVLDPVLVATSGDRLGAEGLADYIKYELCPLTYVLTPNLPEAETLTGLSIQSGEGRSKAASKLLASGVKQVIIKGGHGTDTDLTDELFGTVNRKIVTKRIETTSTHGTGCTFASALATQIAKGVDIETAFCSAVDYVQKAIEHAPGFGAGHGPLNHGHVLN